MNKLQKDTRKIEAIIKKKTGRTKENVFFLLTNLSSEVGELCDEVIGLEGERVEDPNYSDKSKLAKEVVDVVMNAMRIANHYDIDFDKWWNDEDRWVKIKNKFK